MLCPAVYGCVARLFVFCLLYAYLCEREHQCCVLLILLWRHSCVNDDTRHRMCSGVKHIFPIFAPTFTPLFDVLCSRCFAAAAPATSYSFCSPLMTHGLSTPLLPLSFVFVVFVSQYLRCLFIFTMWCVIRPGSIATSPVEAISCKHRSRKRAPLFICHAICGI